VSLLAAAVVSWAGTAAASPLFELVGASTGTGGYNARATGASAASTYFNPALLPRADGSIELGFVVLSDQIAMTLDGRPPRGNVPLVVGGRNLEVNRQPIPNDTVPTDWLERGCKTDVCQPPFTPRPRQAAGSSGNTRPYALVGLVSHVIDDYLVAGFYALLPLGDFTAANSFYNDHREQFFSNSLHPEMYADRLLATSLSVGVGSQLFEELALGVSFTLSLMNEANAGTYVREASDYDQILMSNDIRVKPTIAPHFGAVYSPFDWWRLSGTVHSEQRFTIETGIVATLPDGKQSSTVRREVHSFVPWTFGLGTEVDLNRGATHEFSLAGGVRYALWSKYLDRHGEEPGVQGSQFDFDDVFSGSLGVRHRTGDVSTYADLTYQPTPVPPQTGSTNYVDNDRAGLLVGGQYEFPVASFALRVGLQAQAQRLLHRYQQKDDALIYDELPDGSVDGLSNAPIPRTEGLQTNNPGWPGFASEGWILGGALSVAVLY
jgi:long-chain fatty acid transport protein